MPEPQDRPVTSAPASPAHRRAHQTARDLERYAELFAQRTRVMRSSAMRDLMAITARPEGISLAGGSARHVALPARAVRGENAPNRSGVRRRGTSVRTDGGV